MIYHPKTKDEYVSLTKDGLVLVDFFATWCGPCKMLGEVLEDIDRDNVVKIVKVDVDVLSNLAMEYQVSAVPTVLLLENGKVKNKSMGYMNKPNLLRFIGK